MLQPVYPKKIFNQIYLKNWLKWKYMKHIISRTYIIIQLKREKEIISTELDRKPQHLKLEKDTTWKWEILTSFNETLLSGHMSKRKLNYIPAGMKVKSAILFSISLIVLSRPLGRNVPELVRTLQIKGITEWRKIKYKFVLQIENDDKKRAENANLLSLLLPVSLSTTVDFFIWGFARLIKYSHSSLLYREKKRKKKRNQQKQSKWSLSESK